MSIIGSHIYQSYIRVLLLECRCLGGQISGLGLRSPAWLDATSLCLWFLPNKELIMSDAISANRSLVVLLFGLESSQQCAYQAFYIRGSTSGTPHSLLNSKLGACPCPCTCIYQGFLNEAWSIDTVPHGQYIQPYTIGEGCFS